MKWIGTFVAWWGELTGLPRKQYKGITVDWAIVSLVVASWVVMVGVHYLFFA